MLKLCLHRALRSAVQKLPSGLRQAPPAAAGVTAARLPGIGRHTPSCLMGTHGRNEPGEPLNSPKRAKEFIYRLHPNERACLLKELQSFESIAIAQVEETLVSRIHKYLLDHLEIRGGNETVVELYCTLSRPPQL
eukprot:superscaffoldBa00005456_g20367